jgi:hypothetical protein
MSSAGLFKFLSGNADIVSRYARKADLNQQPIVDALEKIGCSVQKLHTVGEGVPDLLVGFRGGTYLLEVKNVHGRNRDTKQQTDWRIWWRGHPVSIVRNEQEAILAVSRHG